jgi:aerobic carbon-monoxide dehydrogenase small subunit
MLINFTVNHNKVSEAIEPRTSLADVLRTKLKLTGTHLRCEQGVCGACTLLIDGHPARACTTLAVACENAEITTIEGLEDDEITKDIREAFMDEHGLQCGFCTPGMLVTARDIVTRLPEADETRVRFELSGNLCRCTGYVGIVRAICRVVDSRRQRSVAPPAIKPRGLGPVGSNFSDTTRYKDKLTAQTISPNEAPSIIVGDLGLNGKIPTIELSQTFVVSKSPDEVWNFLGDLSKVVPCLPGATLTQPIVDNLASGQFAVKLGPITAKFSGEVQVLRDKAKMCGTILGAGRDGLSGSRTRAEIKYSLFPSANLNSTRVDFTISALISGPLAQFSRAGIVEDLVSRITKAFSDNLGRRLSSSTGDEIEMQGAPLMAGSLLRSVFLKKWKFFLRRVRG